MRETTESSKGQRARQISDNNTRSHLLSSSSTTPHGVNIFAALGGDAARSSHPLHLTSCLARGREQIELTADGA
jgi:hypothetical protein